MPNFLNKLFQGVAPKNVNKSHFDLSHEWKHDMNPGFLIPFLKIPCLPGDEFTISSEFFFKTNPLYYPAIHRFKLEADYYFIRYSVMWPETLDGELNGWKNWIMAKADVLHPTTDVEMVFQTSNADNMSVMGYFGIPYLYDGEGRGTVITGLNAFPAMAYLHIYDQYYRNPELEDERRFYLTDGDNTSAFQDAYDYHGTGPENRLNVFPSKWDRDYLTACLPTPQAGDPVQIPMTTGYGEQGQYANFPTRWKRLDTGATPSEGPLEIDTDGDTQTDVPQPVGLDIQTGAATVAELRFAEILQQFRERLIKIGRRYRDYIKGMHDEDVNPLELELPIMIGNYRGAVQISEVLTQAMTTVGEDNFNTGDYSGNASLYETNNQPFRFNAKDYGLIIGIMNVTPNTGYGQGINRYWRYSTPYDYPLDMFCTIGDQEVLKEEVMYNNLQADAAKNQETFGYIERYAEARHINNIYGTNLARNAGLSIHAGKWYDPQTTTGSNYDAAIEINKDFIDADPTGIGATLKGGTRVTDIFRTLTLSNGLPTEMTIVAYVMHRISVLRALPLYSTPSS